MSGETQLKPCPHHLRTEPEAEKAEFEFYGRKEDKVRHFVICLACGSRGPTSETRDGAIEAWNRRATPPGYEMVPEGTRNILQRFANAAYNIKQNLTIPQDWRDSLSGLQAEADKVLQAIAASKRKDKEPT